MAAFIAVGQWVLCGSTRKATKPERLFPVWKSHRATQTLKTSSNGGSRLSAAIQFSRVADSAERLLTPPQRPQRYACAQGPMVYKQ